MKNKFYDCLKEFNTTFKPTVDYAKLILEEFTEFATAVEFENNDENSLKELCDLLYVINGYVEVNNLLPIDKNTKEVEALLKAIKAQESLEVAKNANLALSVVAGAAMDFLITRNTEHGKEWLYRLTQAVFAYAEHNKWPIAQAFTRVHKSNMSKLEDGKVLRREDGKVLKGKNYKAPNLKDLCNGNKVDIKQKRSKRSAG